VPLCLVAAALAALASLRLLRQRPDYAIRHVVLISLDTCRPDRLSCYGYPKKTTPNIDRLAAHGVLFANAYTPIPTTLPAHCSMMTGQIPPIHGVFSQGVFLPPAAHTLAETLKTEGFTTGAFTSSFVLDSRFSMDQGFDTYDDDFPDSPYNARRRPGDQTSARAMKWLEDNADANRLFLFAHYFDAHAHFGSYVDTKGSFFSPVPLTEDFTNDPYASGVAFADHCVGMVIDKLKELGLYESTLIIITGDHGEMLGEHGEDYHGYFIYESNIRVPLVIRLPNQTQARRVEDAVGLIDILPTVCSLLNIPPPTFVRSGSQLLSSGPADHRPAAPLPLLRKLHGPTHVRHQHAVRPGRARLQVHPHHATGAVPLANRPGRGQQSRGRRAQPRPGHGQPPGRRPDRRSHDADRRYPTRPRP